MSGLENVTFENFDPSKMPLNTYFQSQVLIKVSQNDLVKSYFQVDLTPVSHYFMMISMIRSHTPDSRDR